MKRTFKCEYLQRDYNKKCQVTTCPANYQDYESGCILNSNKTITSKLLSSLFKKPIRQIDKKIARIRSILQLLININKKLEDFDYLGDYCFCGKPELKCKGNNKCNKRLRKYRKFLRKLIKHNIPLQITPQEYYFLVKEKMDLDIG
jgi:hypothetical protein